MALTVHVNVDRPLAFGGLEKEDLGVIIVCALTAYYFSDGIFVTAGISAAVLLWIKHIKKGKPPGYLKHWVYRHVPLKSFTPRGLPLGNIRRFGPGVARREGGLSRE